MYGTLNLSTFKVLIFPTKILKINFCTLHGNIELYQECVHFCQMATGIILLCNERPFSTVYVNVMYFILVKKRSFLTENLVKI